jgi:hypothetical protein
MLEQTPTVDNDDRLPGDGDDVCVPDVVDIQYIANSLLQEDTGTATW